MLEVWGKGLLQWNHAQMATCWFLLPHAYGQMVTVNNYRAMDSIPSQADHLDPGHHMSNVAKELLYRDARQTAQKLC